MTRVRKTRRVDDPRVQKNIENVRNRGKNVFQTPFKKCVNYTSQISRLIRIRTSYLKTT